MAEDRRIADTFAREQHRLRNFIRKQVVDIDDADDILQDVFYELVEATRLMRPIEHVSAWLFRVARNRITDLFRRKKAHGPTDGSAAIIGEEMLLFEDLLPSPDAGPEAAYTRQVLLEEIEAALDELPDEQRSVFVAHEIEGRSFKELAAETGLKVNTLIARKHYAVLRLRRRLQAIYNEFLNA
jgi:RNA polymerase sigma factor (sigma-70 family)